MASKEVWLVRKSDGYAFRKQGLKHYNKVDFDEVLSDTNPMLAEAPAPLNFDNDEDLYPAGDE